MCIFLDSFSLWGPYVYMCGNFTLALREYQLTLCPVMRPGISHSSLPACFKYTYKGGGHQNVYFKVSIPWGSQKYKFQVGVPSRTPMRPLGPGSRLFVEGTSGSPKRLLMWASRSSSCKEMSKTRLSAGPSFVNCAWPHTSMC